MGLRFRKSIKIAPGVKVNLNKKSTSITFGGKGVHYTVNSKGKTTKSVGIPGTGISYSTSKNKKKTFKENHSFSGQMDYSEFINYDYCELLTEKEFDFYIKNKKNGFLFDVDPKAILTQTGKRNTITTYKVCHAITLIVSILLFLISLVGFTVSIPSGIVFLLLSAVMFFPFKGYRKMVKIHQKIFSHKNF